MPLLRTPCWSGDMPVSIEAWDGSVMGAAAKTCSKSTPAAARLSRVGVAS
jgi:hypothetical protein